MVKITETHVQSMTLSRGTSEPRLKAILRNFVSCTYNDEAFDLIFIAMIPIEK